MARWRRRNVTIKHENLYVTFQQGSKHLCCKDATYKTRLKDFTVSMKDEGDRKWQSLVTLHFKVKGKFSNNTNVGGWVYWLNTAGGCGQSICSCKKASRVQK